MQLRPRNRRRSVLFGTILLAGIGTMYGVASAESPDAAVERARETARRTADVEGSLRSLERDVGSKASAHARNRAASIAEAARAFKPVDVASVPQDWEAAGLDISKAEREGDRLVQVLPDGSRVTFTVDPDVQEHLDGMLDDYNVPHGGVVLVEPATGRVRAMASHTEHDPPIRQLARKSTAPSASVFKIITASALIESAGINPEAEVCYHGGRSRLTARNIKGDRRRDHKCADLGSAIAWSINSIMAKLAYYNLSREDLTVWAEKFGYNTEIPFELSVEKSTAEFVEDPLERARSAAGFWHTYLSPLHGALIGATVANGGVMMRPTLIEKYESADGEVLYEFEPEVFRRVMSEKTADILGELMQQTATKGTARRYFKYRRGFPDEVVVGGKTGTLSNKKPYLGFTWFVGFGVDARLDDTPVAVSGLICNTPKWRIKGPYAASEAVRKYFEVVHHRQSSEVATR